MNKQTNKDVDDFEYKTLKYLHNIFVCLMQIKYYIKKLTLL